MDKATVIALRKQFHHLSDRVNENGGIDIPLLISIDHGNTIVDEMTSCIMWDDENEVLYSIEYNNEVTDPLYDICPVRIRAFDYIVIQAITCRVDRTVLGKFFDIAIGKGITTAEIKADYDRRLVDLRDPRKYVDGDKSTYRSTDKSQYFPSTEDPVLRKNFFDNL